MRPLSKRAIVLLAACSLITLLLLGAHLFNLPFLSDAEHYVQDWFLRLGRRVPPDPRLVLVGIDRPSYAQDILPAEAEADPVLDALRRNFPWSRNVWAVLIDKLANAGAKAIVIDLVFANPGDGDDALQRLHRVHDLQQQRPRAGIEPVRVLDGQQRGHGPRLLAEQLREQMLGVCRAHVTGHFRGEFIIRD